MIPRLFRFSLENHMIETRDQILKKIRDNQQKIKSFGVRKLSLFGSFAVGNASQNSDLDFLAELENETFDAYMGLKLFLEELFHRRVDLVLPSTIKPRLKAQILSEAIDAA